MIKRGLAMDRLMRWTGVVSFLILGILIFMIFSDIQTMFTLIAVSIIGISLACLFLFFVNQYREFLDDLLIPIVIILSALFPYFHVYLSNTEQYHKLDTQNKKILKDWCKQNLSWPTIILQNRIFFVTVNDAATFRLRWL